MGDGYDPVIPGLDLNMYEMKTATGSAQKLRFVLPHLRQSNPLRRRLRTQRKTAGPQKIRRLLAQSVCAPCVLCGFEIIEHKQYLIATWGSI